MGGKVRKHDFLKPIAPIKMIFQTKVTKLAQIDMLTT